MLKIVIPKTETTVTINGEVEFQSYGPYEIQLEHSLVSISKWESKWKKSFFLKENKTTDELYDYVRLMTITQGIPNEAYTILSVANIETIQKYIEDPMTATTFSSNESGSNSEIITSELVYYWMIANNIPMECQKWHINRLLTLIRVCGIKNSPPKKMSRSEMYKRNRSINEARKAKYQTKG